MVVAQLVERSLPSSEVRSLNPVIGKIHNEHVNCIENTKIKEKRGRAMAHFLVLQIVVCKICSLLVRYSQNENYPRVATSVTRKNRQMSIKVAQQ